MRKVGYHGSTSEYYEKSIHYHDSQKYLHIVCMYLDKIGESSQFSSLLYKFGKIPGPEQTWRKV